MLRVQRISGVASWRSAAVAALSGPSSLTTLCASPASASSSTASSSSSSAITTRLFTRSAHTRPSQRALEHFNQPNQKREVFAYGIGQGARGIALNRPSALNSLNLPIVRQLTNILHALEQDKDVAVAVLHGLGDKAFCAGGDVRALHDAGLQRKAAKNLTGDHDLTKRFFREEYTLNFLMSHLSVPVIAVMNGITMGGGVGISCHLRYRAATPNTLFAMPETAIGFFPDVGATYLLPRLYGTTGESQLGMFLGLTGHRLKGYDVVHAGIATHFVADNDFEELLELAFNTNGLKYAQAEDAIEDIFWNMSADFRARAPAFSLEPHMGWIDRCFSRPTVEQIMGELEKETSDVAQRALAALKSASPLALKVTHRALLEGAKKPLEECLTTEYRLSQRFMLDHDFYAGVNSALISKDRSPKWAHASLAEVPDRLVAAYFAPLQDQEELQLQYPKWKQEQWYI